ncbi:hypothetical protein GJ496_003675 [Pomphorhynchus laevis]|nr:hypothetical protein GJ496_003675 [Pomphorhynchus laevis]
MNLSSSQFSSNKNMLVTSTWRYGYLAFACDILKYQLYITVDDRDYSFSIEKGYLSLKPEAVFKIRSTSNQGYVEIQHNLSQKYVCIEQSGRPVLKNVNDFERFDSEKNQCRFKRKTDSFGIVSFTSTTINYDKSKKESEQYSLGFSPLLLINSKTYPEMYKIYVPTYPNAKAPCFKPDAEEQR